MAASSFEEGLAARLEELQGQLAAEHRRTVHHVESRISALEAENARLHRHCLKLLASCPPGSIDEDLVAMRPHRHSHVRRGSNMSNVRRGSNMSQLSNVMRVPPARMSILSNLTTVSDVSGVDPPRHGVAQGCDPPRGPRKFSHRTTSQDKLPYLPGQPHALSTPIQAIMSEEEEPADVEECDRPSAAIPSPEQALSVKDADNSESELSGSEDYHDFAMLEAWELARAGRGRKLNRKQSTIFSHIMPDGPTHEANARLEKQLEGFMMQPNCMKRLVWEALAFLLIVLELFLIPLQVLEPWRTDIEAIAAAAWFARVYWTLDILLTFVTGYISDTEHGMTEARFRMVAWRYATGRLAFDCAVVACDWAGVALDPARADVSLLRFMLVIRGLRIFRVVSLLKARNVTDFILERIHSEVTMISSYMFGILFILILLIHMVACVWCGVRTRWNIGDDSFTERYMLSFHIILALFAGEHIVEPANLFERCFIIVVLIFAFVITASFVGSLTTAMTRLQIIASKRSQQFAMLSRYLSEWGISRSLAKRVQRNAEYAFKVRKRITPESCVELFALISDPLRSEIHYEVHAPILTRHPFFYVYNKMDLTSVRHICHSVFSEVSISRGDVLFTEFEVQVAPKMHFILSGRLSYNRGILDRMKITSPQWVSEPTLWTTWSHLGSLVANTECRFLALDAQRFVNVTSNFSTPFASTYAEKFVQRLNSDSAHNALTDVGEDDEACRQLVYDCFSELGQTEMVPQDWIREGRNSVFSHGSLLSVGSAATDSQTLMLTGPPKKSPSLRGTPSKPPQP